MLLPSSGEVTFTRDRSIMQGAQSCTFRYSSRRDNEYTRSISRDGAKSIPGQQRT